MMLIMKGSGPITITKGPIMNYDWSASMSMSMTVDVSGETGNVDMV